MDKERGSLENDDYNKEHVTKKRATIVVTHRGDGHWFRIANTERLLTKITNRGYGQRLRTKVTDKSHGQRLRMAVTNSGYK